MSEPQHVAMLLDERPPDCRRPGHIPCLECAPYVVERSFALELPVAAPRRPRAKARPRRPQVAPLLVELLQLGAELGAIDIAKAAARKPVIDALRALASRLEKLP